MPAITKLAQPGTTEKPVHLARATGEQPDVEIKDQSLVGKSSLDRDSGARLLRYGCVVPFIGGGFEVLYGAKELKQGDTHEQKRDGVVDIARGTVSLAGSAAHLPMYAATYLPSLVSLAHPTMAMLGLVGGIAGTLNTLIDGVRDVSNGVKDHRPADVGWGLTKVLIGAVQAYGSFTVNVPLMMATNIAFAAVAGIQNRTAVANACKGLGQKVSHAFSSSDG